jgi:hypothetical protein
MEASMSRRGHDNAVAESFFAEFKEGKNQPNKV